MQKTKAQQNGHNWSDGPYIELDSKNNIIYWEDSTGYWEMWEHDELDREIYWEDSIGYWEKWEYHKRGYLYDNKKGKKKVAQ